MNTITREAYEGEGDIVSRLRNWRGLHLAHGGRLFEEAADEIERLRNGSLSGRDTAQQEPVAWRVYAVGGEVVYSLYEQARAAADELNWSVEPLFAKQQNALWIPVTEQLPTEGVMVLGWDKADGMVLTINVCVSKGGNLIWFGCSPSAGEYEDAKRYSDPTHWMPLPAPPTDAK
jgi:hypothetical protein